MGAHDAVAGDDDTEWVVANGFADGAAFWRAPILCSIAAAMLP